MTMISLKVLYDLKDRLKDADIGQSAATDVERTVLDWAEANGLLEQKQDLSFDWQGFFERTAFLPLREVNLTGAPVPPVAGGGTSSLKPKAWTAEEDAQAVQLRVAGSSYPEIATARGRPLQGVKFRFHTRLNARVDAARATLNAEAAEEARPAEAEKAEAPEDSDSEPAATATAAAPAAPPAAGRGGVACREQSPSIAATPAPAFDPSQPLWARQINATLNAIGYKPPFTPQLDLELVERLAQGEKLAEIAADTGIDAGKLKARFLALTPDGRPTLTEQQHLIEVLRVRAEAARLKAAE